MSKIVTATTDCLMCPIGGPASDRITLRQVTGDERRILLGVSMLGITLVKTGLVPSKISALGIEFTKTDQKSLLSIVALITAYFVVAFAIYAVADFIARRFAFRAALGEAFAQRKKRESEMQDNDERYLREVLARGQVVFVLSKPFSLIRALFEFLLPILVGIYAIITVLRAPVP